jgi:hypothetical protein
MSRHIDLSAQADVYDDTVRIANEITGPTARYVIYLSVEQSPPALGRVFGRIGGLAIIPEQSRITVGEDDVIDLVLEIRSAEPYKLDLLCRQLAQLTETIHIRVVSG